MAFDWVEYHTLAKELAERPDESAQRSAISRAYYAAFGLARAQLENEGVVFAADSTEHEEVWQNYEKIDTGPRYYIGMNGRRLRRLRNTADYRNELTDPVGSVKRALKAAQDILNDLQRLASEE